MSDLYNIPINNYKNSVPKFFDEKVHASEFLHPTLLVIRMKT